MAKSIFAINTVPLFPEAPNGIRIRQKKNVKVFNTPNQTKNKIQILGRESKVFTIVGRYLATTEKNLLEGLANNDTKVTCIYTDQDSVSDTFEAYFENIEFIEHINGWSYNLTVREV